MSELTMERVAAMSVQYWHYSLEYFLDSMVKCGIKNIEFWPGEPHYYRGDYLSAGEAAKRIREIRKQMDDRGLKVIMYTPETLGYPFNPAGRDERYRSRTIDMYKTAMEDALEFGTNKLFCNSGWGLLDEPREDAWKRSADTFRQISDYAGKMGIEICLEQLQPYESNLVCTSSDVKRMLDEVGADNFNSCIDIGAMAVAGEEIEDFYSKFPKKITHVHFSDLNHEVPGDRGLPLKKYIDVLNANHYEGYLSLEVNDTMYIDDPHTPFLRSAEYLRGMLPEK